MDAGRRTAGPDLRALALCYTAGALAVFAQRELPDLLALGFATLTLILVPRWRAHLGMLLLGASMTTWQAQHQLAQRWPESRHNEELSVRGHIASLPELSVIKGRKGEERTWRFLFKPDSSELPRTRVSWYRSDAEPRGGECWELRLRMKTPHGSLNPGGFDYEGWLFRQGIGATATAKTGDRCAGEGGHILLDVRQRIVEQLRLWLPSHPAEPLMAALLVGDDSGISDADWDLFRLSGTSHLIAISGFNVGLVTGAAFFLLRWLWSLWPALCLRLAAQKAALAGSALAAALYALLAGFEPPVARALVMLLILLGALWLRRLSQPSRVLALAWMVIVVPDPLALMSPGLWLSFGAVAAIFYVSMQRLGKLDLVRGFVALQLMLSLLLAPLSLYFFQGTSWAGPVVNLLAVPLFAVLTPLALAAALLAWLAPAIGLPVLVATADVLGGFRDALQLVAAQPQLWLAASPPAAALALAFFGALLLFVPRGLPLQLTGLLCFAPLWFPPDTAPAAGVEVATLDVGQGLAVVLRTREHTLLFDSGPAFEEGFDAGESVVVPYLLSQGVRRVDRMLISHGDNDHSGGAAAVRRVLEIRDALGFGAEKPCRDGGHWEWDGVSFSVLHPDDKDWGDNNGSCVLRVETSGHAILLPGDIEKAAEARLVREHSAELRADVLMAPHHGSKTSSTQGFAEAVHPQLVIYSAGWRHHFGHPAAPVVERYAALGAQALHTGRQGTLLLRVGSEGVSPVRRQREFAAHWWNAPLEDLQGVQPPAAESGG